MLAMFAAALLGVGAGIVIPLVTKAIIDGPVARGERSLLLPLALVAFGLGAVEAILTFVRRWIQSTAVLGMETAIRGDLYRSLQRLPVSFHDRWQSGQLLSRAVTDLGVIRRFIGFGLIFLIVNVLTYATVLVLLLRLSVTLGLIVLVSTLPILTISRSWTRRYFEISRRVQDQQGDLATVVEESAGGVRVVKAFGRRELVDARFGQAAERLAGSWMDAVALRARFWTLLDVIPNLSLAVVLCVGALAVAKGLLSLGGLIAFLSLQLQLVWPIDALGWILAIGQEAATAAERVYEVLDTPVEIADLPGAVALGRVQGRLRFEGVGFRYPGADRPVLRDVSLEVEPGETLALVGATGSGKTTLVSLVPRLYDVSQGRITMDGHDLRGLRLDSLRRVVAVGFEEPILFSASVRENLMLGVAEATDEELATALEVAKAEFVFELPWGLDTRIGEQGLSLSGGQRQRLALARAVLARPRVLVLDDPLSALDVHTEALVEEALARVLAGTTGLVVVHRPSTLALADRVALLEGGTISAVGTHSELLASTPAYRAILSQDPEGSGEPQRGAPVDREGSGQPQRGAPVDRERSGQPQRDAPVDREGSGQPQRGAPVDRERSGQPQRGAPVGREGAGADADGARAAAS
jgi:ATP-binding cassette subfamily B protein